MALTLSVIIPAYNEELYIKELLARVLRVKLAPVKMEVIVVDDGSKDQTAQIVRSFGKKVIFAQHKKNRGKGAAIRTGIKKAKGDIIIIQDADLEYNPGDFPKLIKPIIQGKTKVVYGSRFLSERQKKKNTKILFTGKHKEANTLFYLGGRMLTLLTNVLYPGANITDEATCYKVFDASLLKRLDLRCEGFEFCPEVTAKVLKRKEKILEVPTTYDPRSQDEGKKIKFRDGIEGVWNLIKFRFMD